MEGNIVFRQGDRVVYADRMFYDARRQIGTILNAELLDAAAAGGRLPVSGPGAIEGGGRAAARRLAVRRPATRFLTTSRLEEPAYSFESQTITLTDQQQPLVDPLHRAWRASIRRRASRRIAHQYQVESQSNFLYVSGRPGVLLADDCHQPREADVLRQQRPRAQRLDLRLPDAVRSSTRFNCWATTTRRKASSGIWISTT